MPAALLPLWLQRRWELEVHCVSTFHLTVPSPCGSHDMQASLQMQRPGCKLLAALQVCEAALAADPPFRRLLIVVRRMR